MNEKKDQAHGDTPKVTREDNPTASAVAPTATAERADWLIWNADYHQFWGPNSGGYFGLWGAGLYTEAEAKSLSRNKDRRDQAHHISGYRDQINNMRGAFERLSAALAASEATR